MNRAFPPITTSLARTLFTAGTSRGKGPCMAANAARNLQSECRNTFVMRWFVGLLLSLILGCNTGNDQPLTTISLSQETQHLLEQMNSLAAEPRDKRSF